MQSGAWQYCDGTNISNGPGEGGATPDLNGSGHSDRMFLRGSSAGTAGTTGGNHVHDHNCNGSNRGDRNGTPRFTNNNTDSQNHLPPYFEVRYIIRVM